MTEVDTGAIERSVNDLLIAIGEDPTRLGLQDTPTRIARFWKEFIDYDPGKIDTIFEAIYLDQLVLVRNIEVWSICEHHLLPFNSKITMGYLTNESVLGLSKFARIAQQVAHRLQLQERITYEIATALQKATGSQDVAVIASGQHLCMTMRGIKTTGDMITSSLHGRFKENTALRQEFLDLAKGGDS